MLCYKCSGRAYIANIGSCTNCGSWTSSGMFHYCSACATKLNKCAACDGQLDAVKPATPPDTKLVYMVHVNVEHYRGAFNPAIGHKGQVRRNRKAFRAFKQNVKDLLVTANLPVDSFTVVTEMINICVIVAQCTQAVAEMVGKLPGAEAMFENQPSC